MGIVSSPRNPRVAAAAKLHRSRARREAGRTLLEGPHLLAEAVRAGAPVEAVFALEDDTTAATLATGGGAELIQVTRQVLERLAPTEHPRGPVAVLATPPPAALGRVDAVVLWGVGDPGNAGTIVRTAAAFGVAVVAGPDTVDLWGPKALRAAAGAHFRVAIGVAASLADLGDRTLVATVPRDGKPLRSASIDGLWAVLVGSEAHGLPDEVLAAAGVAVTIPMPGRVESLNAATAAAIVLYELTAGG